MKSLLPPTLQSAWDVQDAVPRRARMTELAFAGYAIPRCGEFSEMRRLNTALVVYLDERAHCGQGKVLWRPGETAEWPPSTFCSEFILSRDEFNDDNKTAFSVRHLVVGHFFCVVDYQSSSSWMSNVDGTYEVRFLPPEMTKHFGHPVLKTTRANDLLRYPMYAVDFVVLDEGPDVAVDLNVCPGVPVEVVNAVGREVLRASLEDFCKSRGFI